MQAEMPNFGLEQLPRPKALEFATLRSMDCKGAEHVVLLVTSIHSFTPGWPEKRLTSSR